MTDISFKSQSSRSSSYQALSETALQANPRESGSIAWPLQAGLAP